MTHPRIHNGYLSNPHRAGDFGQLEQAQRRKEARTGSAKLLCAMLRYFERRAAA